MGSEDAAKSKGEKMWARRQVEKTKQKFARQGLEEMEEKAKQSEVDRVTGQWDCTVARNRFEEARRLQAKREELWRKIRKKCGEEVKHFEKIDEQLQRLQQQATEEQSKEQSDEQSIVGVTAVRARGELEVFEETIRCEQGQSIAALEQKISELAQAAESREQERQESSLREGKLQEQLAKAKREAEKSRLEREQASMEGEDLRALCVWQQNMVRVCIAA